MSIIKYVDGRMPPRHLLDSSFAIFTAKPAAVHGTASQAVSFSPLLVRPRSIPGLTLSAAVHHLCAVFGADRRAEA